MLAATPPGCLVYMSEKEGQYLFCLSNQVAWWKKNPPHDFVGEGEGGEDGFLSDIRHVEQVDFLHILISKRVFS